MPYYQIYIVYDDKKGKQTDMLTFDNGESFVKKIATRYMKNQALLIAGKIIHTSQINQILIFQTEKKFKDLILPDGASPLEKNYSDIINGFCSPLMIGVKLVNYKFITSLPEKKEEPTKTPTKPLDRKKKIFIVHGRDVEQALLLQKYLDKKLKLDAIMFDDLPDKGKTIIEQLEYIKDNVGYAIAIVTPDDVGCLVEDIDQLETVMTRGKKSLKIKELDEILDLLTTRPRQNVIFELGLFIGALGRDKVCYLLHKDVQDELSDLHGILHKSFDKSVKEVFHEIAEELKEAGYEIKE